MNSHTRTYSTSTHTNTQTLSSTDKSYQNLAIVFLVNVLIIEHMAWS